MAVSSEITARDRQGRIRISIDVDATQLARVTEMLDGIPGGLRKALVLAVNDTLRAGKQVVVGGLFQILTLKQKDIRSRVIVTKATDSKPVGYINLPREQFALKRFKFTEKRKKKGWGTAASGQGVFVQVFRDGETLRFPHAFVATTETRGKGIFQRTTLGPGSDREKITVAGGAVSVGAIFWSRPELGQRLVERLQEQFEKNIISKAKFVLERSGR